MTHSDMDAPHCGRRIGVATAALVACLWPAVARADHLPRPTLSGEAQVGQVMRADIPGERPESWVWYRCRAGHVRGECPRIAGATEQTYRIAEADEGHILRASAYDDGHDSRWSAVPSAVIRPAATPVNVSPPALTSSDTPTVRPPSAVTWTLGTWTGASALTLAVQRCRPDASGCQTVTGGTVGYAPGLGVTYTVRPDDLGDVLVLAVQAADVDASRVRSGPTPVVIGERAATPPSGSPPPPVVTPPSGATPAPAVPAPPPPPSPAPTKPSPAGVVAALRARLDVNVVRLTWRAPKGATVVVVRRIGARPRHAADGKVVYRGTARATRDTPRAARRVWYGVFLVDAVGPSSGSGASRPVYASLPRVTPRLLAPLQGVRTGRTVRFLWRPVATARYYNVQIWNDGVTRRILSRWPTQRSLTLRLRPGRYRWYVYPGYGAPASVRYGALIGQGSFRVG